MKSDSLTRHLLVPAIMPVLFFAVASTPVDLLGCRTRGFIAFSIAFLSGIAAVVTGILALKGRIKSEAGSERWMLTTLMLAVPVVALLILA
jgi:hypothetical protein